MGDEATISGEALFDLTSTLTSSDSKRAGQKKLWNFFITFLFDIRLFFKK